MPDKLKISLRVQSTIVGSEEYTISVEVTNITEKALANISVEPQLLPGRPISLRESPSHSELDHLEEQKVSLIRELEEQVAKAYEKAILRKKTAFERFMAIYSRMDEIVAESIASFFTKGPRKIPKYFPIPYWAKEASKINEWEDLLRLERDIMSNEPDSFLKKAFFIDKEKLEKVLNKIAEAKKSSIKHIDLSDSIIIQPGETITFPFRYIAPNLYHQKSFDIHFKVQYLDLEKQTTGNYSVTESVKIYSSYFAVPLGAGLGSIAGFIVKTVFISPIDWFSKRFWIYLSGSILLAIIVAFITSRSAESKKVFTVEDFIGGFVIGAISGLFSEKFINYLSSFTPK